MPLAGEAEGGERSLPLLLAALQGSRPGEVVHRLVPRAGASGGVGAPRARRRRQTVDPARGAGPPMRHLKLFLLRVLAPLAISGVAIWCSLRPPWLPKERHTDLAAVGRAMASADATRIVEYVAMLLV